MHYTGCYDTGKAEKMETYTKEELEGYLEYSKKLWNTIEMKFDANEGIKIERIENSEAKEFVKEYSKTLAEVLSPVKQMVFNQTLIDFTSWIYVNCPLTGHIGRSRVAAVPAPVQLNEHLPIFNSNEGDLKE